MGPNVTFAFMEVGLVCYLDGSIKAHLSVPSEGEE